MYALQAHMYALQAHMYALQAHMYALQAHVFDGFKVDQMFEGVKISPNVWGC